MLKRSTVLMNALLILFLAVNAVAADKKIQTSKSRSSTRLVKPPPVEEGLKFSFAFNERLMIQAERQDDGSRNQYFAHEFIPTIATTNYNILADFVYYDRYNKPETSEWDATAFILGMNKPMALSTYFDFAPQMLLILPLFPNDSSGDFQGAIGPQGTLTLKTKELNMPGLILKYGWRILKFSQRNEFKKDASGNPSLDAAGDKQYTTDWRFRQRFHIGYSFTDKLTFMLYAHIDSNLLFNSEYRNGFLHETTLEYAVNDHFSVHIGTTNGGGIYAGDYQEQDNVKFYDKVSSEHFAGFGLSF